MFDLINHIHNSFQEVTQYESVYLAENKNETNQCFVVSNQKWMCASAVYEVATRNLKQKYEYKQIVPEIDIMMLCEDGKDFYQKYRSKAERPWRTLVRSVQNIAHFFFCICPTPLKDAEEAVEKQYQDYVSTLEWLNSLTHKASIQLKQEGKEIAQKVLQVAVDYLVSDELMVATKSCIVASNFFKKGKFKMAFITFMNPVMLAINKGLKSTLDKQMPEVSQLIKAEALMNK